MRVFRALSEVPADFGPSVVAIGKFDGMHLGHRAVLAQLRKDAAASAAQSVVITFDRHPATLLRPDETPTSLTDNDRKLELLAAEGIDAVLLVAFDQRFADLDPEDFVREYLVETLDAKKVLVGRDFRFGHGAAGNASTLERLGQEYGFELHIVTDVAADGSGRRLSSTVIRQLLAEGDVEEVATALGRPVEVRGEVVHGLKRGRELGFPTANLLPKPEMAVPADGVYAGWLVEQVSGLRHPAAISVGTNPTFDDVHQRQVESFVLDRDDLDLYGKIVTVEFVKRLRGMVAYNGVEALIEQMNEDVKATRATLFG
jgi:riboflavin kinase/FMN adenylyltransferase